MPQFARQPAVAEWTGTPQFQPTEFYLNAVDGVLRQGTIVGEQIQIGVLLLVLIENGQCLPPRCLLLVVDLAQVEHGALHRLGGGDSLILDDAEVAMILAVLLAICAAQKQAISRMPETLRFGKRVGLHSAVFRNCVLPRRGLGLTHTRKWSLTAKDRLTIECVGSSTNMHLVKVSVLFAGAAAYSMPAQPYLAPGRIVDIGNRKLLLYCSGAGGPTT